MKPIIIDWGWRFDVIQCPDFIADNINDYQMQFDQWLGDKNNDHGYWVSYPPVEPGFPDPYHPRDPDGKDAVSWGVVEFMEWLNEFIEFNDSDEKVTLIEFQLYDRVRIQKMVDTGITRIYG